MITININKAKVIAHNIRRSARSKEFEPLDSLIAKQIPVTDLVNIEAHRQIIRDKYAVIQTDIDNVQNIESLKYCISLFNIP